MLRLGILLPRSTLFPSLGLDILNGLKACLQINQLQDSFKFITDNIGFGIEEAEVYAKAEKMLLQEDADIVLVIADARIQELLEPLFTASNKILLMVNFGANIPERWMAAPTTIVHSLNFCLYTRLSGKLAATETNKEAINVASFYDAGYRQCYSFLNSHQQMGGIPVYTHVTHFSKENFSLQPVDDYLDTHTEVKNLLCLFAGDDAEQFYEAIPELQKKYPLHLFVAPMLLDESIIHKIDESAQLKNIKGYAPWISFLSNQNNTRFTEAYSEIYKKSANLFVVLGWDAGLLLQAILLQKDAGINSASEIISQIGNTIFNSPRGWLKLDAATNHTFGPAWLLSYDSANKLKIVEEFTEIEKEWKEFTNEEFSGGESSGWRNTYLCV